MLSFLTVTVIASLSYPDGSHRKVWLPDATIEYLRGKHIVMFTIAILILLAGVAYTAVLFSWQWLLRHQDKKVFSWTKHQKLCHFIEPYHAPYTFEQCYWTDLLFLYVQFCTLFQLSILLAIPKCLLCQQSFLLASYHY